MDITEFARLGGKARALKLTPERRKQIAINAINKRWKKEDTSKQVLQDGEYVHDGMVFDHDGRYVRLVACKRCQYTARLHPDVAGHAFEAEI